MKNFVLLTSSRCFLATCFVVVCSTTFADTIDRIVFGSCNHQDKPQPIWTPILAEHPDLFIFLGDNVYADTTDPDKLRATYQRLADKPGFQQLRATTNIVATWDDHDYGKNDAGAELKGKASSREIMLDFWNEPKDSPRRTQPGGIYTAYLLGEPGKIVQVILLDTRWNRTPLVTVKDKEELRQREQANMGPYEQSLAAGATLLGQEQWAWLEQQLQVKADLRIIGSSIQVLSDFTGWESWSNFPRDRLQLIELLTKYQHEPIVLISGDTHWAELSEIRDGDLEWPLIELTSSGLTQEWANISPNRHRLGKGFAKANYGVIDLDWTASPPAVSLSIKDSHNKVQIQQNVRYPNTN